jgi:signal peptidase II
MYKIFQIALISLFCDQLSKLTMLYVFDLPLVGKIDVLPPYLQFTMAWNYGVNFGLFANSTEIMRWVLIIIAFLICFVVVRWSVSEKFGTLGLVACGFLVGGAAGNAIDRLFHGAVVDFLNVSCCGINNPFAFNVADIFIFLGAIGLVFFSDKQNESD